jgi:hypothetical protein
VTAEFFSSLTWSFVTDEATRRRVDPVLIPSFRIDPRHASGRLARDMLWSPTIRAAYLARYTHRVAISNRRLISADQRLTEGSSQSYKSAVRRFRPVKKFGGRFFRLTHGSWRAYRTGLRFPLRASIRFEASALVRSG